MGILSEIKLVIVILVFAAFGFLYAEYTHEKNMREKAEEKINLQENNYGKGSDLLSSELKDKTIDSLLKSQAIKPKNVQSITNIHYHYAGVIKDTTIVVNGDSSKCIEYNNKGIKISGCKGLYSIQQDFTATAVLHLKPTKHFLFIKYKKKPTLQAWTAWGDSLNIKLVEK